MTNSCISGFGVLNRNLIPYCYWCNFNNHLFTRTRLTFKQTQHYPKLSLNNNLGVKFIYQRSNYQYCHKTTKNESLAVTIFPLNLPPGPKGIARLLKLVSITSVTFLLVNPTVFSQVQLTWEQLTIDIPLLLYSSICFKIPKHHTLLCTSHLNLLEVLPLLYTCKLFPLCCKSFPFCVAFINS